MSIVQGYQFLPMIGDPDDHRPQTEWATVVDPGGPEGEVRTLAVLLERIGPGDSIPLHRHPIDEVIFVDGEGAHVRLGAERRTVPAGSVVFVPAGVAHGTSNRSGSPLPIRAVFPATRVGIEYLERNAAPGTEGDDPQPATTIDLLTGEVS